MAKTISSLFFFLALMTIISTKDQGKIHFPLVKSRPAFLTLNKKVVKFIIQLFFFSLLILFYSFSPYSLSFSYIQKEELLWKQRNYKQFYLSLLLLNDRWKLNLTFRPTWKTDSHSAQLCDLRQVI